MTSSTSPFPAAEETTERTSTITKELAHVMHDENLFVHHVARGGAHEYVSAFVIDGDHPYLYENPAIANHVSGTTFIDVSRQLLKAICHIYYDVPVTSRFILRDIQVSFLLWAKIGVPIDVRVSVQPPSIARRNWRVFGTWIFPRKGDPWRSEHLHSSPYLRSSKRISCRASSASTMRRAPLERMHCDSRAKDSNASRSRIDASGAELEAAVAILRAPSPSRIE